MGRWRRATFRMKQSAPSRRARRSNGEIQRRNFSLAFLYECGRGVALDLAEAAFWYRKAADQGNPDERLIEDVRARGHDLDLVAKPVTISGEAYLLF